MLLRHRPPPLRSGAIEPRPGFEHLEPRALSVLRWLNANRVDFVLVGPVAAAIRGAAGPGGPVAVVPAPYGRNYERLTRALVAEHAGLRSESGLGERPETPTTVPVRLTADKLARGRRWMLRFAGYDLDIEACAEAGSGREMVPSSSGHDGPRRAHDARAPRYQELLYEATRFELADEVVVEVASPEDLEHFSHVRRTGVAPEFRVIRNPVDERAPTPPAPDPVRDPAAGSDGPDAAAP